MSIMRIYNAVENAEILKKYFPEYDGITFTISDKKKRIICNCGKVIPLESNHLTTQCDCGGHNYYSLGADGLYYAINGRMGIVKISEIQKSMDAEGNQTAFVSSLVLTVEDKKLMKFEEEDIVLATLSSDGILKFLENSLLSRHRVRNYSDTRLTASDIVEVFDNFEEQRELADMISVRNFPEYWECLSEIFTNPDVVEVARTYPQLFEKAFESDTNASNITSFDKLCSAVRIPPALKNFWTVYSNRGGYYNIENNLYKLVELKKSRVELGSHLERLVQRGIVPPEICAEIYDLYKATDNILAGKRMDMDYRFSYAAKKFIDSMNISVELMELFESFVRDNIVEYSRMIFEKFIERYHWCEENGITPTEFTLNSKEYYKNLNEKLGGRPKFHEEVLTNPLEAIKYY